MRAVLLGAAALLACGTEPDNTPAAMEPDGDIVLSGTAGLALPQRPAVRVTTSSRKPVNAVTVLFSVTQGGGSTSGSGTTDASGIARTVWTLGSTSGENRLVASIAGITQTVTFIASGLPGSPALLEIVAGSGQTGRVGSVLPTRPAVKVSDMFGNPNRNVGVTFAVSAGGGSIADATPVTDLSGVATAGAWTLGTTAGTHRLTATVTGAATTDIVATATSGAAAQLKKSAGDQDSVVAGTAVPTPPAVKVVDAFDNPVSGVTVTFAVDAGNGSITGAQQQTNAQGLASVGSWVLGTKAGTNTLTASAAGLSAVTFTVTGRAGPATAIALSPDTVSLSPGDTVSLSVAARDTNANTTSIPTLTWSSTNTTIVTVSSSGLLTARDRGTAKIIAKSGALADTTTVIVAPGPPEVTTTNTRGITSGSIWLGASVVQRGDSTKVWFEYGTSPTLAGAAATTKTLLGSGVIGNNRRISGLLPNTTYYYRALAENVVGKDTGAIQSSRTSPSGGRELLKQTGLSGITSRADFEVPAGTTRLEVSAVTATTAEGAYLYLRFGQAAEVIAADCVSQYISTAGETQLQACAIENPTAGRWHVLVVGFYSNVTLTALAHGLVEPVAVSVSPTVDTLAVGGTRQYTATVTGTSNTAVTWTSSNTTVADVSASGLVTAKAVGQATIRARSAADTSKSATATLQVVANPIVISLTPAVDTLAVGGTRQYTATVTGTSNTAVTWTSSNTTVADVSASGLVTAKAVGQTTIRARSAADTSKSATATLQVLTNLIAISLTPTVDTLAVGTTRQFIARVTNASDTTVTWTSSNTTVADVSASGLATAKAVGQTTIRARSVADTSKSATATLTVTTQTTSLLTLANDVPITGLSGSGGKIQFFKFTVPQGSGVFAARTLGGTGDVNMLIRRGALPNDGQYDCASSTSPTTEEVCELTPAVVLDVQPHHGDWYISLTNGLGVPFSGVKLVATYDSTSQNAVTTLQNDQSVPGLNDTTRLSMKHHFKIAVPAGRTSLSVTVSGTGPVPDLLVKHKRQSKSNLVASEECQADGANKTTVTCTLTNPPSGYWYIALWAFRTYTGVTLTVRYQ